MRRRVRDEFERRVIGRDRGAVETRYYPAAGATSGALFVGGVGGGFDSPARDLYLRLCRELTERRISCLRVRFRHPGDLDESVADVVAGIDELVRLGAPRVGLVGHSFGAAVVIRAAVEREPAAAVVTLAGQAFGADVAAALAPRPLLIVHGADDRVLTPRSSEMIYGWAREPKELKIFGGAGHSLDEVESEVCPLVRDFLHAHLDGAPPA